jgi:predicted TIM-barrel fold metal-dependent hydrolase
LPLNDAVWDPIYEFASERNLAVIAHTGPGHESEPDKFGEAAGRFPEANFVAGHAGIYEPYRSQAIDAAQRFPNYYLETCSTYREPGVIEELVEKAGADRVLYGSDIPLMDPRAQIGKVITADISDEAKRLVLGDNARRLLKL